MHRFDDDSEEVTSIRGGAADAYWPFYIDVDNPNRFVGFTEERDQEYRQNDERAIPPHNLQLRRLMTEVERLHELPPGTVQLTEDLDEESGTVRYRLYSGLNGNSPLLNSHFRNEEVIYNVLHRLYPLRSRIAFKRWRAVSPEMTEVSPSPGPQNVTDSAIEGSRKRSLSESGNDFESAHDKRRREIEAFRDRRQSEGTRINKWINDRRKAVGAEHLGLMRWVVAPPEEYTPRRWDPVGEDIFMRFNEGQPWTRNLNTGWVTSFKDTIQANRGLRAYKEAIIAHTNPSSVADNNLLEEYGYKSFWKRTPRGRYTNVRAPTEYSPVEDE